MFTDAPVGADSEGSMDDFRATDVERPWVGAHLRVARGCGIIERYTHSCLDLNTVHFYIRTRCTSNGNDRRMQPYRFFYRCGETPRILEDFLPNLGLGRQFIHRAGYGM